MHHPLSKSYKHTYPFRLATTSFIYPDGYIQNVKMLAPYLDEIELLMFESAEKSLPSERDIETLSLLAKESDLTYNIHLPVDVSLTDKNPSESRRALEAVRRVIELTAKLSPSTFTLHLPYDEPSRRKEDVRIWQDIAYKNVEALMSAGISSDAERISVETMNYPIEWAERIINDHHLSVCLDIGHLIRYGFDMEAVFDRYSDITSILHVHGVENGRDHIALNRLSEIRSDAVMKILKQFKGTVSLEVFSYKDLTASLTFLEERWGRVMRDT
ncbi:cobamide remodeling phosphodiesterase CbiR [Desulfococcaceae bacterium HSG8]|nr:cobamide remodeling phosphodiesterase CbiR [Desulfococcaceae bacterium HSG8]